MPNTMFMRVEDVAEEMGVSVSYAYKLIRKLNKELKATGCITIPVSYTHLRAALSDVVEIFDERLGQPVYGLSLIHI